MPLKSDRHLSIRGTLFFVGLSLFFYLPPFPHVAFGQQSITADGTMNTQVNFAQSNYTISGGRIRAGNQFHSFSGFGVQTNESATFTGPNNIQNIIGRVTGGEQSFIDGLLRSEIDGANLFLLNPSGVIFGPNASLDLTGAFHASTADYLRLGENGILYADIAENSILTMDPPSAFGFLRANPAGITLDESVLVMPEEQILTFVSGDITIRGNPDLAADAVEVGRIEVPGGSVNLVSVASTGEVGLTNQQEIAPLNLDAFDQLGMIEIADNAYIDTGGMGGGSIIIRGGQFLITGDSNVYASTRLPSTNDNGSQGIDIDVTENATISGSFLGTHVFEGISDDSGGIRIRADSIDVNSGALVASVAYIDSIGNSGDISLDANHLIIDNASVETGMFGHGESGDINVNAESVVVQNAGWLYSPVGGGTGNGGDINITADSLQLTNTYYPWGYICGIGTRTYNPGIGKAGDIAVSVNTLAMGPGTEISTPTFGWGDETNRYIGGNIAITARDSLTIAGTEYPDYNGNQIYTGIFSNTFGSGQGGNISISSPQIEMSNHVSAQASAFYYGNAGAVMIDSDTIELRDGAYLTSSGLYGWGGSGGSVTVNAGRLSIIGRQDSTEPFERDFTGITTTAGYSGGNGGNIALNLDERLFMTNRGSINATSYGPGLSGDIIIDAPRLEVFNGSTIISNAFGTGDGGNLQLSTAYLHIDGVHPMVLKNQNGVATMSPSAIGTQAGIYGGNGGDLNVTADRLHITDGGRITAESFGAGDGGRITISSQTVTVDGINDRQAAFQIANGWDPMAARSSISASTDSSYGGVDMTNEGGSVAITSDALYLRNGGMIATGTETSGDGGDISIDTFHTALTNDAIISAGSTGEGDAGDIYLKALDELFMFSSSIRTQSQISDGGNIKISAKSLIDLWNSEISASVGGGEDTVGGNIDIDPKYVVLSNSRLIANAFEGAGGNIHIVADYLVLDPNSSISASSEYGIDGNVDIQALTQPDSEGIDPLSKEFQSAVTLLREPCIARMSAGQKGSLIVNEREGLPIEPGGLLPSPFTLN